MNLVQPPPADACAGCSFPTVLLQDIDIRMETGKLREQHGGIKLVWDALERSFGKKTVDDFVWKNA